MNERFLPKYDINDYLNQNETPIDPSELNPDVFVDGIAPIILEPRFITAASGTGKAPNTIVIIDNTVQDYIPDGYDRTVIITSSEDLKVSPENPEALSLSSNFVNQSEIIQMLGRTGRKSS